jgi:predicted LPLAT superfamily acyltransferase
MSSDTASRTQSPAPIPQWAEPDISPAWKYKFVSWVIRYGGRARAYHIALFASFWYVLFYPSIRQRCRFYLDRRFPARTRWHQRFHDDLKLVRIYAETLADMIILRVLGPNALSAHCPQHDQLIERCAAEQGFLLVHAHVGCFQIGMSALTQFPKAVSIVMIPEPGAAPPASIIDSRGGLDTVMQMTAAVLRGEIVAMMGDRIFGSDRNVAPVRFLGGKALFPITAYRVASATHVPVLVMTAPKTAKSSYELRVAKVINVPPGLGRDPAEYAPYAQQFADCIEQFTNDFPWQVFNFYNLWEVSGSAALGRKDSDYR